MLEKLNKITFVGFAICLVLPIMEVKYRYVYGYLGPNDPGIGTDIWNMFTEHWDDINFLFGFHPEVAVVPFAFLIQMLIFLKNKAFFKGIGHFLDHYLTYIFLFIAIILNLFLIDDAYTHHVTKFYFWFGAYIFFSLIVINFIIKMALHIQSKKASQQVENQF